jgi:hypothetical protein
MTKLNPWTFGAVLSITIVTNYVLCTLFWFAFTEPAIKFLNVLFHGMDFRKIYAITAFSPGDFLYVLVVLAVWAYVLGAVYAIVRNLLLGQAASG